MFELFCKAKAQVGPQSFIQLPTLDPTTSVAQLVARIVNWILWIAGVLAVIYLVYSGILYITAGGDAEKATKGRTGVINAIIGIVIIILAVVIVSWVSDVVTQNF